VYAFKSFDDGSGEALYAGGAFVLAGSQISSRLARWRCPCPHCDANDDGRVDAMDLGMFVPCMDGPNARYKDGCENARLDAGHDVDLADFAVMQNFLGPGP
jgi:hypothetical protein